MNIKCLFTAYLFLVSSVALCQSMDFNGNIMAVDSIVIDGVSTSGALKGSGRQQTIDRKVSEFSSIESNGSFDIVYQQGVFALSLTGDDNIIPHVLTKIVDTTLVISMNKSYQSQHAIILNISAPFINAMTVKGSSDIKLQQIKTDNLHLKLSGSGDVFAEGRVNNLKIDIDGTVEGTFKQLMANNVTVDIDGMGDIELTALRKLNVNVSGVADVVFFGHPSQVNKNISGLAEIVSGD